MRLGLNRHSMFAFFFNQTSARVELKLTSVTCKIDHELRQIRCARNRFVIDYCWLKIDCKKILPLSRKGLFAFFCDLAAFHCDLSHVDHVCDKSTPHASRQRDDRAIVADFFDSTSTPKLLLHQLLQL